MVVRIYDRYSLDFVSPLFLVGFRANLAIATEPSALAVICISSSRFFLIQPLKTSSNWHTLNLKNC